MDVQAGGKRTGVDASPSGLCGGPSLFVHSQRTVWPSCVFYRQGGSGEVYAYLPEFERNTKQLLAVPPKSHGNHQFGFSVGRGAFTFTRGRWATVAERVKLNDPGEENGGHKFDPSLPRCVSNPTSQVNWNFG